MTASGPGVPGRGDGTDDTPRRGIGRQLALILGIGLIVRLILAYGLPPFFGSPIPGSGFKTDLDLFRYWAGNLAQHGPSGFYDRGFFADYTPGYLYALWLVGVVGSVIGGVGDLIKLPAILTDVALAYVVYAMVRELGVAERRARLAALVVIVNPITWFDSVVWGQVDSFGTVFLLLAVRELWRGRSERSAVLAVVAALVKPQLAILVPIVAAVVIRRALWPAGGWGDEDAPQARGSAWERRTTGWIRILTTGVSGLVTALVLCLPFGLPLVWPTGTSLLKLMFSTASTYPYITVNAYNAWALLPVADASGAVSSLASSSLWIHDSPAKDAASWAQVGPFPAGIVGAVLLLAVAALVTYLVARRPDRPTILVGVAVLALAFFAVPTRVHERYLFPLFGLAAILLAFSWRWRLAYLLASAATFLNMYVVLTTLYPDNPSVADWLGIGPSVRSFSGVALIAVTQTAVFLWSIAQLRRGASRRLAAELDAARAEADPAEDGALDHAAASARRAVQAAPVRADAPSASDATATPVRHAPPRLVPAWFDRPSLGSLTPLAWLRARIAETPIRPDRSGRLRGERGGRLDRLDLWVLIVLVLAALTLRTYRLAEPARMHFDEVYHARTATEFLQDWRYGVSHNIYEWTHPHLAKYLMAGGIVAFAGHDVAASSTLGVAVRDAAIEPRFDDGTNRGGDRVFAVTGTQLVAYDLQTRREEARWDIAGASTVTVDPTTHAVTVGTDTGGLETVDATTLDQVRAGVSGAAAAAVSEIGRLGAAPVQLFAWDGGSTLAARMADGTVEMIQAVDQPNAPVGTMLGRVKLDGAADLVDAGDGDALTATLANVTDPKTEAKTLAGIAGGEAAAYQRALEATGVPTVVLPVTLTSEIRNALKPALDGGRLPGVAIGKAPLLAVADARGVTLLADSAAVADRVALGGGAFGLDRVTGLGSGDQLYVSTRDAANGTPQVAIVATSGDPAKTGPAVTSTMPMPGAVTKVLYDDAAQLVEVLGAAQTGGDPTVYVIEPHGNAVFADHRLGFTPTALVMDHNADYPSSSRGQILAFSAAGAVAALDIGHYDFSWRLPGVIFGALTAAAVYVLARILFRRRLVAGLAGLFVLLDGMMFVQSRIAMNDVYVGFFILAAYALFAWLWVEPRPRRWFWLLMPVIGLLLGLGLGSKWVAAYAIGALGILVLARSALGRLVLVLGMLGLTAVLGWMALAVPSDSTSSGNVLFPLIMIVLTLAAVAIAVYRPVAWSDDEIRFAVGAPPAAGILLAFAAVALGKAGSSIALGQLRLTPLPLAFALVLLGGAAFVAFHVAGRLGVGPMAAAADAPRGLTADAAPEGWLRIGDGLGLSTAWWVLCLVGLPVVVYVLLYLPWAFVEGHQIVAGWPPGHAGQTLVDLTGEMYRYHNDLSAPHAASSPWWAWPLNLKPVWFYQGSFAGETGAAIYDAGTMAIWWLAIPAMAFVGYQAFRRRSLALALVLIGFLAQWISWARIERASFQYHDYTGLPFLILALAYFTAEIWHGPSQRAWLLARASAAVAVMGPALFWLLRLPLCRIADVEAMNKSSQACNGNPGNLVVTPSVGALIAILLVGGGILVWQLVKLSRPRADGRPLGAGDARGVLTTGILVVAGALATRLLPSGDPLISVAGLAPEPLALVALVPLGLVAVQIVTARDARRFAGGLLAAVGINFVVLYPNIAALPLPTSIVPWYQGVLPTYLYAFQFWSNTSNRGQGVSLSDPRFLVLVGFLAVASIAVAYSARTWRQALAGEPDAGGADAPSGAGTG